MSRGLRIDRWAQRLILSIVLVGLVYLAFAVVAHLVDPRWPPLAFGKVRTAVEVLTWPGSWIGSVLVVTGMNPFPAGWAYISIWTWSGCAYTVLVFAVLSLFVWLRGNASARN